MIMNEMERRQAEFGLVSMCIGGVWSGRNIPAYLEIYF
jgi:acetyl-CoA acetyltransferase